ncbi:MAG: hypothetical protein HC930_17720, partial [Hydrococcus sp. SU_1_0]|nr:hypothetical protein [Hydrococcus sp. SU_1_0]
ELIQEDIERINRLGSTALTATCNATGYTGSYAEALWDALEADDILRAGTPTPTPPPPPTKTIIKKINSNGLVDTGGKQLALRRFHVSSTVNNSTSPHRTLKVGYQVWNWMVIIKTKLMARLLL